jgi:alpha/beta superfamily hydrolase
LEALFWRVESPRAAAIVCHPHPLFGGTMHNHVAYRIADALRANGVSALRFNFRGVGRLTGVHDEGRKEVDDAQAALDYLAREQPHVPLWVAGFSFGARVALKLATEDARVSQSLAVGLATNLFDYSFVSQLTKPKAFIQAEHDEYAELDKVRALIDSLAPPKKLWVLPQSGHLCTGRLDDFRALALEAASWLLQPN